MQTTTEQEEFWSGKFGDEYVTRNNSEYSVASNTSLFSKVLRSAPNVNSVIEFGANIGLNLMALKNLKPDCALTGVEINETAFGELKSLNYVEAIHDTLLEYNTDKTYDLSFVKGVLIHINPDKLEKAYELLYRTSKKYVLIAEYYNPSPVMINYRGHENRLFKRDFAGEFMAKYPDMKLVDYGFVYRKDPNFPQDDLTWFLMERA